MSLFLGGVKIDGVYFGGTSDGFQPVEQVFITPGAFNYTVPAGATRVDAVLLGGGGGSTRGGAGWRDGAGGSAGVWNAKTFVVGTDVAPGATISGVVGAGGVAETGSNAAGIGGTSSISGASGFSALGGSGGTSQSSTGLSPGTREFNGRTYVGGLETPGTGGNGGPGNPPGGGGSGGNGVVAGFSDGAAGGPGRVWLYAYSGTAGLAQAVYLGVEKVWPAFVPTETVYTTNGSFTYTIPADCKAVDVIMCSGGAAGTNGSLAGNGRGGLSGNWGAVTLTRGGNLPMSTTTLTIVVGTGGSGNGVAGGLNYVSGTGVTQVTVAGGSGSAGVTDPQGKGPGNYTFNGRNFTGGANQGNLNQPGNAPGGGSAGGGYNSNAGPGAVGRTWVYAY